MRGCWHKGLYSIISPCLSLALLFLSAFLPFPSLLFTSLFLSFSPYSFIIVPSVPPILVTRSCPSLFPSLYLFFFFIICLSCSLLPPSYHSFVYIPPLSCSPEFLSSPDIMSSFCLSLFSLPLSIPSSSSL